MKLSCFRMFFLSLSVILFVVSVNAENVIFEDHFDDIAGGDGDGSGHFAKSWIIEYVSLFGGAGTEENAAQPVPNSEPYWTFFHTDRDDQSAIHIDTGVAAAGGTDYVLSYYRGGRDDNPLYYGVFTAQLWAGDPTDGGTLIGESASANPASGEVLFVNHTFTCSSSVSGNLFIRFHAGVSVDGNTYQQPLLDSVVLSESTSGAKASLPIPGNNASPMDFDMTLEWTGGSSAISFDVLFGTDSDNLTLLNTVSESSYTLPALKAGTHYYWRIDSYNSSGGKVMGDEWNFTTKGEYAYWPMDEGTGDTVSDVLNGIVGTFTNEPSWTTGRAGQAVYFDGIDDYIELPALNLNSNRLTISAWIKLDGTQNDWAGLFFSRAGNTCAGLSLAPGNELRYHWNDDEYSWGSNLYVPENVWAFVALVIEPEKATLYLEAEGKSYAKTHFVGHSIEQFNGVTLLGRDAFSSDRSFRGIIDDVRIYDYPLTGQEVLAIQGDINKDGAVNLLDLSDLCRLWLSSSDPLFSKPSDLNSDDNSDNLDFAAISRNWQHKRVWEDPITQFILTPPPAPTPRINGAKIFGVRPGKPFLFKVAATGTKPLMYAAANLPAGLTIDSQTGIITGTAPAVEDTYVVNLTVTNSLGQVQRDLRIKVGDEICLTPPMSWNSWYIWSESISEQKMREMAQAMVDSGLIDHGWTYINMDDCWQGERGGPYNAIQPNTRFNDLNEMCDFIHSLGLKVGIYSTPWQGSYDGFMGGSSPTANGDYSAYYRDEDDPKRTQDTQFFGRYPGSLDIGMNSVGPYWFVDKDIQQWCDWGFDMVKMDWYPNDIPNVTHIYNDLLAGSRDIVYSLSNSTPFENIAEISTMCNLWRTTGDIHDTWSSMSSKGFGVEPWRPYAGPGHWNDQDMLQVGILGRTNWFTTEADLRPTKLTLDEQYTQVSLWCLTACPLILSCDLTKLDAFTISLLTNDEVIEVNQDPLGQQASKVRDEGDLEVWAKDMENGTKSVGLFNRSSSPATVTVQWSDLGIEGGRIIRDLWRQEDLGTYNGSFETQVKGHGVVLVNIRPAL